MNGHHRISYTLGVQTKEEMLGIQREFAKLQAARCGVTINIPPENNAAFLASGCVDIAMARMADDIRYDLALFGDEA